MNTLKRTEGEYRFYQDDRERIKGRSMLPTETLRYIEALEEVAKAAFDYWHKSNRRTPGQEQSASALYDALKVVDFMDENV